MTAVFSLLFCFPPCKTHGTHTSSVCFFSQLTRHKDNRLIKSLVSPHFSHLLVSLSPCLENRDDKSTRAIRQGKKVGTHGTHHTTDATRIAIRIGQEHHPFLQVLSCSSHRHSQPFIHSWSCPTPTPPPCLTFLRHYGTKKYS